MNDTISPSEKIRQLRLQRELSQENMADMLGLSTTAYGDMERGRTELSFSRLESIAKLLDVSLPALLGFETKTLSETEWLRQENERLLSANAKLQGEIDQWKKRFGSLVTLEIGRQVQQHREPIGF
jgi:transcriptional regulator with XRE-family HTH domain